MHVRAPALVFVAHMLFLSCAAAEEQHMRTSWYSSGHTTASGERFDPDDPTIAAHRTLPFGTLLRLTNPANGAQVTVEIKDRGPFIDGRSLDVSRAAARQLGFLHRGVVLLDVLVVHTPG